MTISWYVWLAAAGILSSSLFVRVLILESGLATVHNVLDTAYKSIFFVSVLAILVPIIFTRAINPEASFDSIRLKDLIENTSSSHDLSSEYSNRSIRIASKALHSETNAMGRNSDSRLQNKMALRGVTFEIDDRANVEPIDGAYEHKAVDDTINRRDDSAPYDSLETGNQRELKKLGYKYKSDILERIDGVSRNDLEISSDIKSVLINTSNFSIPFVSNYLFSIVTGDIPSILSQALKELPTMHVVYSVPLQMKVGNKKLVDVRVTDKIIEDLRASLRKSEKILSGIKDVRLNPRGVEMKLIAEPDEFKILPIRSGRQAIISDSLSAWDWQITPLRAGSNLLSIETNAEFYVPSLNESFSQNLNIFEENITVEVNPFFEAKKVLIGSRKDLLTITIASGFASLFTKVWEKQKKMAEEQKRNIYMGSGNYVESNPGTYVQGDYANMSQDLSQAAEQIQNLLKKLQDQGVEVNDAQEKVATDLAAKARSEQTVKTNLLRWGQSLGDATVTDVVKGVVKLAIRSAGLPLP